MLLGLTVTNARSRPSLEPPALTGLTSDRVVALDSSWREAIGMPITKESARDIAAKHVSDQSGETIHSSALTPVTADWPDGAYRTSSDPVWAVRVPSATHGVGGDRYICVCRLDGRVVFDGVIGE